MHVEVYICLVLTMVSTRNIVLFCACCRKNRLLIRIISAPSLIYKNLKKKKRYEKNKIKTDWLFFSIYMHEFQC